MEQCRVLFLAQCCGRRVVVSSVQHHFYAVVTACLSVEDRGVGMYAVVLSENTCWC